MVTESSRYEPATGDGGRARCRPNGNYEPDSWRRWWRNVDRTTAPTTGPTSADAWDAWRSEWYSPDRPSGYSAWGPSPRGPYGSAGQGRCGWNGYACGTGSPRDQSAKRQPWWRVAGTARARVQSARDHASPRPRPAVSRYEVALWLLYSRPRLI